MTEIYNIMHKDLAAASLSQNGECRIFSPEFMPYSLYLEEGSDVDTHVNNLINFFAWCSERLLPLDRTYVKEILGSIGAPQAKSDRERAGIAISYHCLSLTDVFWVKKNDEELDFSGINLYDNHLSNAFVDISLRGRQISASNYELAPDLSTGGMFPKAWVRTDEGFLLYKDGSDKAVENEILASRIARCFDCPQVMYEESVYEDRKVSASRIFTDKSYSICSWGAFQIWAENHKIDPMQYILDLDEKNFFMMNIIDYLVGNTDRHRENWGLLIDNETNRPVSLHPLMDFNKAFEMYDTPEGANCQTVLPKIMTQKQAAEEAVSAVGLNQKKDVRKEWFRGRKQDLEMFGKRLGSL